MKWFIGGLLAGVFLLLCMPIAAQIYSMRSPDYTCSVDVLPSQARILEYEIVSTSGEASGWPLGIVCTFETAAGGVVIVGPGWFASILVIALVTVLASGAIALLAVRARRRLTKVSSA